MPVAVSGPGAAAAGLLLGDIYLTMAAFCRDVRHRVVPADVPELADGISRGWCRGGWHRVHQLSRQRPGLSGPQLTGLLHDTTGGYMVPMLVTGAIILSGAVLLMASGSHKHIPRGAPMMGSGTVID